MDMQALVGVAIVVGGILTPTAVATWNTITDEPGSVWTNDFFGWFLGGLLGSFVATGLVSYILPPDAPDWLAILALCLVPIAGPVITFLAVAALMLGLFGVVLLCMSPFMLADLISKLVGKRKTPAQNA